MSKPCVADIKAGEIIQFGEQNFLFLDHAPSDNLFDLAKNFTVDHYGDPVYNPTIDQVKQDLYNVGPLWCPDLFEKHVVAIIGYDDASQSISLVDSDDWLNSGPGIKNTDYDVFVNKMKSNKGYYRTVYDREPLSGHLVYPYTARINITHPNGRKNLHVWIEPVNPNPNLPLIPPLIVWNQNNTFNVTDPLQNLTIDVPLPNLTGLPPWCVSGRSDGIYGCGTGGTYPY